MMASGPTDHLLQGAKPYENMLGNGKCLGIKLIYKQPTLSNIHTF